MSNLSSKEIGELNAGRLSDWVKVTELKNVPRNYLGTSSKSAICRLIGISTSTIGTNIEIKNIFDALDSELADSIPKGRLQSPPTETRDLHSSVVKQLLDNIDELEAKLARLQHLSDSAQWIPK